MNPKADEAVESGTPMKLGGTWDTPMLNYNANANVLGAYNSTDACVPKIEGCMTVGSVNYDPTANVNTNSWCIPKVEGCMLPPKGFANYKADAVFETTAHTFDGFGDVGKYGLSESKYGIITSMKMEDCVLRTSEVGPLKTFRCGCTKRMRRTTTRTRRLRSATPAIPSRATRRRRAASTRRRSTTAARPPANSQGAPSPRG